MIKITLSKDAYKRIEDEFRYKFEDYIGIFDVDKKDEVTLTVSKEGVFKAGYVNKQKIDSAIFGLAKKLLEYNLIDSLEISKTDIDTLADEVRELDKINRTIILDKNLNLIIEHPVFDKIKYNLLAWKNKELIHPYFFEKDIELCKENELMFNITPEQMEKLKLLQSKESELTHKAYFFKSGDGYRLLLYETQNEIIDIFTNKCKIWYNRHKRGQLEKIELVFTRQELQEEINQDEPNYDKIKQLMNSGYASFNNKMFTFPSVKLLLKKNNVAYEGDDALITSYPNFDFKMSDIKPWDIQKEAFDKWVENEMIGTIALPTGSGKTIIGCMALKGVNRKRTLIVVPTVELLEQWKKFIIKFLNVPEEKIGIYYGGEKNIQDITIITFQSGHRKISSEIDDFKDEEDDDNINKDEDELIEEITKLSDSSALVILDEGHHAPAPIFQRIMIGIKSPYRLSLTATPYREDKNETLAFMAMGDVVYKQDYGTLAKRKYVSPILYNKVTCRLDENESDVIEEFAKLKVERKYRGKGYGVDILNEINEKNGDIYYNKLLEEYFNITPQKVSVGNIIYFSKSKFNELKKLCIKHKNDKILIYNQRVKGAKIIYKFIRELGIKQVALITGSTDGDARRLSLNLFSKSSNGIIVTTTVLDEGIDVPDANVVIIFNGSGAKRQMIQRIGRGCRYVENKIEYVYEFVSAPIEDNPADKAIIDRTVAEKRKQPWARDVNIDDYQISKIGGMKYEYQLKARKLLLIEEITSKYRNIDDTINIDEQNELIKNVKEIKRKNSPNQTDWEKEIGEKAKIRIHKESNNVKIKQISEAKTILLEKFSSGATKIIIRRSKSGGFRIIWK
jgi:superfamily II DNA or RNA helicase